MKGISTAEVARRYQAGETLEALAKDYGCAPGTIATRLDMAGVPRRPRGVVPRLPNADDLLAFELREQGVSLREIGRRLGVTHPEVARRLRRFYL